MSVILGWGGGRQPWLCSKTLSQSETKTPNKTKTRASAAYFRLPVLCCGALFPSPHPRILNSMQCFFPIPPCLSFIQTRASIWQSTKEPWASCLSVFNQMNGFGENGVPVLWATESRWGCLLICFGTLCRSGLF